MILASAHPRLGFPPAIVFGFASLVGTSIATSAPIDTAGITHPTIVAAAAMLLGNAFGYVSELGSQLLASKKSAEA
jgi:hypothetical protein